MSLLKKIGLRGWRCRHCIWINPNLLNFCSIYMVVMFTLAYGRVWILPCRWRVQNQPQEALLHLLLFGLKDESLEDTENLPAPKVLATEIAENHAYMHATGVTLGLLRLYQIRKITEAKFFVIAPEDIISKFQTEISKGPFHQIRERYIFRSYHQLVDMFNCALIYHKLKDEFFNEE